MSPISIKIETTSNLPNRLKKKKYIPMYNVQQLSNQFMVKTILTLTKKNLMQYMIRPKYSMRQQSIELIKYDN